MRPPESMRSGRFRRLWAASAISNIGDGVRLTALPLLATELTGDPRLVAGVAVAEHVPMLLLSLPAGVLTDRFDRRTLRVWLDVVRAVAVGALAVLVAIDRADMLSVFVVAAILGGAESVVDTSSMAVVTSVVDESHLERAGGVMSATELIANSLVGPPLGGLLFALAVAVPFGFDAASFLMAALIMATMPGRFKPGRVDVAGRPSFGREVIDGMRWLWRHRLLRNLALVSVVLGFANLIYGAVFVLYARETLGLGPVGVGVLTIAPAFGGVAGSMAAAKLADWPLRVVLFGAVTVSAVALLAASTTSNPWVFAALIAVEAFAVLTWNVLTTALRQRLVPDHLLGRVIASYRFFVLAAMPLGAVVGGLIAQATTLATTFFVAGMIELAVACVVPWAVGLSPSASGAD